MVKDNIRKYQGVYWDDKLPIVKGILKFDQKDLSGVKGLNLNKGMSLDVQIEEGYFSELIRARFGEYFFFIKITDFLLQDDSYLKQIRSNRKRLIERGLLSPIKGFDT